MDGRSAAQVQQRARGGGPPVFIRKPAALGPRAAGKVSQRIAALLLAGLTLFLIACGDTAPAASSVSIAAPPTATAPIASVAPEPSPTVAPAASEPTATTPPTTVIVPTATVPPMATAGTSAITASTGPDVPPGAAPSPALPTPTATATIAPSATPTVPAPTATQVKADPAYYAEYLKARGWTVLREPLVAEVTGNGVLATLYVTYGQDCGSCHMQRVTVFVGRTVIFDGTNYAEPTLSALVDRSGFVIEEHFPGATESWGHPTGWRRRTLTWQGTSFVETEKKEYVPPAATQTPKPTATQTPKATATAASTARSIKFSVVLPDGSPAKGLTISAVAEVYDQAGKPTGTKVCPQTGCTTSSPEIAFALPQGWQGAITIAVPGYQSAVYTITVQADRTVIVTLVPAR